MNGPFFKSKPFVSKKWRDSARGQNCTLSLSGCRNDTETTVLCHIRPFSNSGVAMKPPDYWAVYGCRHCHTLLDQNPDAWGLDDLLYALKRTLDIHFQEGRIK